jgi:dTDP-4-dehydrorhamnose reductase
MRVLVTGARGQVARSVVECAADMPELEVIAVGRPDLDLERPGSADRLISAVVPDVVINAAAHTAVDDAEREPQRAYRINAEAAGEVAAAALEHGAAIIQISTDYVFDGAAAEPYDESAVPDPLNVYGKSKLAGEEQVRAANPRHVIIRTAWVYSPFGRNFVKTIMKAAETRDTLTVVDDQRGSPTSALDLAGALLHMLQGELAFGEIYHVAGCGSTSWCGFAEAIMEDCRRLGLAAADVQPIASADWPTAARRPVNSALNSFRFEHDFGYSMPRWEESLPGIIGRISSVA